MSDTDKLNEYNNLINKSCIGLIKREYNYDLELDKFKNFPICKLNIPNIYDSILSSSPHLDSQKQLISDKLIDIKTLYFYLGNSQSRFYLDAFEIVGNGELEKADEKAVLWLQSTHYQVYLISSIYEKMIDLFEIIWTGELTNIKNNKIGKKLKVLWDKESFDIVKTEENEVLTEFRNGIRRGEIHGTSSIFRQLYHEKWNHLSEEKKIIDLIIDRFSNKFNS